MRRIRIPGPPWRRNYDSIRRELGEMDKGESLIVNAKDVNLNSLRVIMSKSRFNVSVKNKRSVVLITMHL